MGYKSLIRSLIVAVIFLALSLVQLIIQIVDMRPLWFVYMFCFCAALFTFLIIVISVDLITKDTKKLTGKIIEVDDKYCKVQINNKFKKFHSRGLGLNQLEVEGEYEFVVTRRTGVLLSTAPVRSAQV